MHCYPIVVGWWIAQGNGGIKGAHSSIHLPLSTIKGNSTSCYMSLLIVLGNKRDTRNISLVNHSKISIRNMQMISLKYSLNTCHIFGTKPSLESMLTYCQLDPRENISVIFWFTICFKMSLNWRTNVLCLHKLLNSHCWCDVNTVLSNMICTYTCRNLFVRV